MMARKFPDWDVFKAKANGACRDRFENLCFAKNLESIKDLFNNKVKCRKIGR